MLSSVTPNKIPCEFLTYDEVLKNIDRYLLESREWRKHNLNYFINLLMQRTLKSHNSPPQVKSRIKSHLTSLSSNIRRIQSDLCMYCIYDAVITYLSLTTKPMVVYYLLEILRAADLEIYEQ